MELATSFICADCININTMKEEIKKISDYDLCHYCNQNKDNVANREVVFDIFKSRFMQSVIPLHDCNSYKIGMFYYGSDDLGVSDVQNMIEFLGLGPERLECDLIEYILSSINKNEDLFIYNDGTIEYNTYEYKWSEFINSVSHKHRFFNDEAKVFLDSLFAIIHEDGVILDSVIKRLDPSISLFRARIANTSRKRAEIYSDPASQFGPPPQNSASEQRMTPTGISAFYASKDRETCFSEVRAITGDTVMSAEFRATKTLRLLDLRELNKISETEFCPLDEHFVDNSHKSQFIKGLIFLLSKPASQRGSSTYLETQIIFEYLRINFGSNIHGLVFSSVQTGMDGVNIVLFPEHSQVQPFFYNSQKTSECVEYQCKGICDSTDTSYTYDIKTSGENIVVKDNNSCLNFVEDSIKVHYIKAVTTEAKEFDTDIVLNPEEYLTTSK